MDPDELDRMSKQVQDLSGRRLSDIRVDLLKTKSVEMTVNRIFDGSFLEGTDRDPSLQSHIILDSDDDDLGDLPPARTTTTLQRQISIPSSPERVASLSPLGLPLTPSPPAPRLSISPPLLLASTSSSTSQPQPQQLRNSPLLSNNPISPIREPSSFMLPEKAPSDASSPPLDLISSPIASSPAPSLHHNARKRRPLFDDDDDDENDDHGIRSQSTQPIMGSQGGTSVMDAIDLASSNDEDDDDGTFSATLQGSAPSTPSTKRQRRKSPPPTFDAMQPQRRTAFSMDYLKEWDYDDSSSSSSSESEKEVAIQRFAKSKRAQSQKKKEEQAAKKKARDEKKRQEKQEKERAKEQLKAEKEKKKMFEQANRLRRKRDDLYSEMILEVDKEFASSSRGELLRQVIIPKEAEIKEVETMYYTIAWSRKCTAEWNEELASFIPYPDKKVRIVQEPQVLIFMPVPELCELVKSSDRDRRIDRMQAAAGNDKQLLLMVEGLETYYKRKNLLRQRDFEQAVIRSIENGHATAESSSSSSSNRRIRDPLTAAAMTGPTKQDMEEALTYFQLMKNIMLVPTTDEEDTVDWIVALTADIGSAPYKKQQLRKHGAFRCGKDPADTWNKMLQEIHLCTPPIAQAVTRTYPTVQSLHHAYKGLADKEERVSMLADVEVDRAITASRGRHINKSMSRKIYTIFSSNDPSQYIS